MHAECQKDVSKTDLGIRLELSENTWRGRSIDKKVTYCMSLLTLLPLLLLLTLLLLLHYYKLLLQLQQLARLWVLRWKGRQKHKSAMFLEWLTVPRWNFQRIMKGMFNSSKGKMYMLQPLIILLLLLLLLRLIQH